MTTATALTMPPNMTTTDLEVTRFAVGQLFLHNPDLPPHQREAWGTVYLSLLNSTPVSVPPAAS